MRELNDAEISLVDGGATGGSISVGEGAAITVGLMVICATPIVIAVGGAALVAYALM
ncbi:MAG: hypothetical protein ACREXR_01230 [Gammaproteobacteria bacterium]